MKEFLKSKWPNMKEEIALRKLLSGNKTSELRNLDTLAHVNGRNS
jgi:hypothetical protein